MTTKISYRIAGNFRGLKFSRILRFLFTHDEALENFDLEFYQSQELI